MSTAAHLKIAFFFFTDTATTEIYTLSLHDALPILRVDQVRRHLDAGDAGVDRDRVAGRERSEEHTSEFQSHHDLVCRLLLEKKKEPRDRRPTARREEQPGQQAYSKPPD